jgi:hypothetical protein
MAETTSTMAETHLCYQAPVPMIQTGGLHLIPHRFLLEGKWV